MIRCEICGQEFLSEERMTIWRGLDGIKRGFCLPCVGREINRRGDDDES